MDDTRTAGEWYDAGDAARRAGDVAAAEQAYRRALEIDPRLANAAYRLGEIALERGQRKAAVDLFRHTLTLQPGHAWAMKQLEAMASASVTTTPGPGPSPAHAAPAAQVAPPNCDPSGEGLVGIVQAVRRSSENYQVRQGTRSVLSVRVRIQYPGEAPGRVVGFEMRGSRITGMIDPGDWIELPAGWQPGDRLRWFSNLTTCDEVFVDESVIGRIFTIVVVTFVIVWIAVIFFVVGRQMFLR
jgi:hypothetical protein